MSRPDAKINLILDEIVRTLRTIDGDPDLWLTKPKSVKRFSPNPLAEPMPFVLVKSKWGPNEPQTGRQHNGQADILIECYTKFGATVDDPARELHRLASDVISALETNWELKDAGGTQVVAGLEGIHLIDGYEPDPTLYTQGFAGTVLEFRVFWPWDATAP